MKAFHNNPKIKEKYLARVRAHALADEIIQGIYWKNGKGCAVGCTIHGSDHGAYELELGIPRIIARLEDGIFEGLPLVEAKKWPEQFLDAIPVGADLSTVWPMFAVWLLTDVLQYSDVNTKKPIQDVIDAYKLILADPGAVIDWAGLARAAAYAAVAAGDAAVAVVVAAYAATTAYYDDEVSRQTKRKEQAEKLLEILRGCK